MTFYYIIFAIFCLRQVTSSIPHWRKDYTRAFVSEWLNTYVFNNLIYVFNTYGTILGTPYLNWNGRKKEIPIHPFCQTWIINSNDKFVRCYQFRHLLLNFSSPCLSIVFIYIFRLF